MEEALLLASSRLHLAVRGSNIGIWEIDMPDGILQTGRVDFTNVWEQLGHDRPTSPSNFATVMALVHPDDLERVLQTLQTYLSGATGELEFEFRARHKNGSDRWMLVRGVAMRDPAGRTIRLIGSCIDITEHKRAESLLRESEERFRGTFENAAVGIAHKGADRRWLRVNEKFCEIVGYTREELLQRTFQDITFPDDLPDELANFALLLRGELASYALEKRCVRKDSSLVWLHTSLSLQRDGSGKPAYAIAILQDISERKRLEVELRQAKEAAESANRAKDGFLANVSHEIRTPMNAIQGMTELVLDTPLNEDQRQCLETARSAADNLLCIINDLLDFSKIEAGKLELDPAGFSLRQVLGDTLRALAVRAHKKGLELVYHVQPDVPDALIGDAGRLRQILLNLVGNAIKFTPRGEVVMRVEVAAELVQDEGAATPGAEGEVGLRFQVSDTGIGIPKDKQDTVFRAFEQEDTSTTRKYGGTGLGLTIAARLVALMGGAISVVSESGRGSTFTFTARFGKQPGLEQSPSSRVGLAAPAVLLHQLSVLIVDDNATNRHILEEWLRQWQMQATSVADGVAAMDALWQSIASGQPYALVLLDAMMPDMDGLTLATLVRQRDQFADLRIILLTSGDRPGDLARSRELRIDAHLLKPIPQDELLETIYRVMNQAAEAGGQEPVARSQVSETLAAPAHGAPLRILVAEDNEFNIRHLERLLRRRGYQVHLAANGREALTALGITGGASADAATPVSAFDLLLLDLHMPELDGFQVTEALRHRERATSGHLPVIALTARSRKEDRERCLAAGMDDYLPKPVRAVELFATIDRALSARGIAQPSPGRKDEPIQPATEEGSRLLDPAVLLLACGEDAEGLHEMCLDFHSYAPTRMAEVANALRDQDGPRLREAAHKLCGLLSAFSTVAGNLASDLEDRAVSGRLDEAQSLVGRLETMTRELHHQLASLTLETLRRTGRSPAMITGEPHVLE